MTTRRQHDYAAAVDVVQAAAREVAGALPGAEIDSIDGEGFLVVKRAGTQRARFVFSATPTGTRVVVDYEIDRGGNRGMFDLFDQYGREVDGWLAAIGRNIAGT